MAGTHGVMNNETSWKHRNTIRKTCLKTYSHIYGIRQTKYKTGSCCKSVKQARVASFFGIIFLCTCLQSILCSTPFKRKIQPSKFLWIVKIFEKLWFCNSVWEAKRRNLGYQIWNCEHNSLIFISWLDCCLIGEILNSIHTN